MDGFFRGIANLIENIFFIALIVIGFGVYCYNKLQGLGQGVKSTNATVLTVIQKRADLVNKLMDIAKGYGDHEKLIHISVSNNLADTYKASTTALANVHSFAMNYPELKANTTYQQLMQQLAGIETELQRKREQYNLTAQEYNTVRLQIPNVFYAKILGFSEAPYFDFDNLKEIKEFQTDDGKLLKEMLTDVSTKAKDLAQKGIESVNTTMQKSPLVKPENKDTTNNS